jgi:predicted transcriptional regulator
MKIKEIRDILKARVLAGKDRLEKEVSGAGCADLMEDILAAVAKEAVLLTGLTSDDVIRTARVAGVAAVVFVRGKKPGESAVTLAESYDLPILLTQDSLFVACGRLYMNGLRGLDGSW